MSLYSPRNQAVFAMAERERLEPIEDAHDFLSDKPEGFCPWCGSALDETYFEDPHLPDVECLNSCPDWDVCSTESENRARYAKEKEAEAKLESKVAMQMARRDMDF